MNLENIPGSFPTKDVMMPILGKKRNIVVCQILETSVLSKSTGTEDKKIGTFPVRKSRRGDRVRV